MFVGPLKVTCDILSARFSLYQTQGFQAKSKGKALNPFLTLKCGSLLPQMGKLLNNNMTHQLNSCPICNLALNWDINFPRVSSVYNT